MRAVTIVALAALFAFAALAPVLENASADHVYTHRYIIQGRVVDEDGRPVSQAIVQAELAGWFPQDEGVEGVCPQEQAGQRTGERTFISQTSALGDYRICIHAHQLTSGGRVLITVGNTTIEEEKDLAIRTTYADIVVPVGDVGEVGDVATFSGEAGIRGRIWRPFTSDDAIEGIPAQGVAIARSTINVTLTLADGTSTSQDVGTTDYGEFGARFSEDGDLEGATFTVRWSREVWEIDASPQFRVIDRDLVVEDALDVGGSGAPGPGLLAALGAVALAALVVGRARRRA